MAHLQFTREPNDTGCDTLVKEQTGYRIDELISENEGKQERKRVSFYHVPLSRLATFRLGFPALDNPIKEVSHRSAQ